MLQEPAILYFIVLHSILVICRNLSVSDEFFSIFILFLTFGIVCKLIDESTKNKMAGSRLNTIRRTVKYLCPADLIPPFIEVDLSELDAGQKILIKDLEVHHELLPLLPKEGPVCNISGGKTYDHTKKSE